MAQTKNKLVRREGPFRVYRAKDGQLYFTVVARNGKTLLTSEMYTQAKGVDNAIEAVQSRVVTHEFDRRCSDSITRRAGR